MKLPPKDHRKHGKQSKSHSKTGKPTEPAQQPPDSEVRRLLAKPLPKPTSRKGILLKHLWENPRLTREQCDRLAFASNSPDLVMQLRNGWGLHIECDRKPKVLPNGQKTRYGIFWLTDQARERLTALGYEG